MDNVKRIVMMKRKASMELDPNELKQSNHSNNFIFYEASRTIGRKIHMGSPIKIGK